MKTLCCFMFLFCLNVFSVLAQVEQNSFKSINSEEEVTQVEGNNGSYWTVSLSGGATLYQGEWDRDMKKADFITPYGKLSVARWFSSVWGIRMQMDGGVFKNGAVKIWEPDSNGKFNFVDGYLEFITNVMNWGESKDSNRPVSVYLYGGGGVAWTPARNDLSAKVSPGMILGGQVNFRLTDFWSIALEVDGTIVKDKFNSHTGGRKYEGTVGVTAGLVYRFSQK